MSIVLGTYGKSAVVSAFTQLSLSYSLGSGTVVFYSGAKPGSPESPTGSILATLSLSNALTAAVAGESILTGPVQANATGTGTIGYALWKDNSASPWFVADVGLDGSGADIILASLSAVSGQPVVMTEAGIKVLKNFGGIRLNTTAQTRFCDAMARAVGSGIGQTATLSIYTGTPPSDGDAAPTGTKLVDIVLSTGGANCWSSVSGGIAPLTSQPKSGTAVASGTAGYGQVVAGASSDRKFYGSVGTSNADFLLDSLSITSGNPVQLLSLSVSA